MKTATRVITQKMMEEVAKTKAAHTEEKVPAKRGRKPKQETTSDVQKSTDTDKAKVAKAVKRGRPRKKSTESNTAPRKRGRKPKTAEATVAAVPKKRGPKPKVKTSSKGKPGPKPKSERTSAATLTSKRRDRKPKTKQATEATIQIAKPKVHEDQAIITLTITGSAEAVHKALLKLQG